MQSVAAWEKAFEKHQGNVSSQTIQALLEHFGLVPRKAAWRCLSCGWGESGECTLTSCPACGRNEIMVWDIDGTHHMLSQIQSEQA